MAIDAVRSAALGFRTATEIEADKVFLSQIRQSGSLPAGADADEVASAVLCTLARRLSIGASKDLVAALPPPIQGLLGPCAVHASDRAETFGAAEFLQAVSSHFQPAPADPEELVRVVFRTIHNHVGRKHIDDVAAQLPADLKSLWISP